MEPGHPGHPGWGQEKPAAPRWNPKQSCVPGAQGYLGQVLHGSGDRSGTRKELFPVRWGRGARHSVSRDIPSSCCLALPALPAIPGQAVPPCGKHPPLLRRGDAPEPSPWMSPPASVLPPLVLCVPLTQHKPPPSPPSAATGALPGPHRLPKYLQGCSHPVPPPSSSVTRGWCPGTLH